MDTGIAATFTKSFEPDNPKHVTWWKLMCDNMDADPVRVAKSNPMGLDFTEKDVMDLVFIQFSIAMKYAKATLEGKSWSPAK